jgi:hypothetical protein
MKVVKPIVIDSSALYSTTATETYSAWASATSYTLGAFVILTSTQRVYQCLIAGVDATSPDASALLTTPHWLDVGPTNKYAMFDSLVGTQTVSTAPLTVVIHPGYVNSLALFGMEGTQVDVTVRDALAGNIVYTYSQPLDGTIIADWYQYYFEPYVQKADVVLTNLPPYVDAYITVTVSGTGTVKCGILAAGTFYTMGDTQYGATASIIDYSKKNTDALGNTTFAKLAYSKRMTANLSLDNGQLNKVQRVLADLRATPCAWLGVDAAGFEPLTVFGFYRNFSIDIAYPTSSYCSLEIEGLT